MNYIIKINFLLLSALLLLTSCTQTPKVSSLDAPLMNGKKILVVYGGWKGHSPKEFVQKIQPWLEEEGATVTLSDSLGIYADVDFLKTQDLIIQTWTGGEISKSQRDGLLTAVKSGVGYAGCHGGTGDSFPKTSKIPYLVGGKWVAHPGGKVDFTVNISDKEDDITMGLSDFDVHSEQYYMVVDPNNKVLATTTFSGEADPWIKGAVMPVIWKKYFGAGRVFYYSLGHNMEEFDILQSWSIMQRGFRWASEGKLQPTEDCLRPVYKK
jgi:type 1 glutamine amidotransferase